MQNSFSVLDFVAQFAVTNQDQEKDVCVALSFTNNDKKKLLIASNGQQVSEPAQKRINQWKTYFSDRDNQQAQNEIASQIIEKLSICFEQLDNKRGFLGNFEAKQKWSQANEDLQEIKRKLKLDRANAYLLLGALEEIIKTAYASLFLFKFPLPDYFYLKNLHTIVFGRSWNSEIEKQMRAIAETELDFVEVKHFKENTINFIEEQTQKARDKIRKFDLEISLLVQEKAGIGPTSEDKDRQIQTVDSKIKELQNEIYHHKDLIVKIFSENTQIKLTDKQITDIVKNSTAIRELITEQVKNYTKIHDEMKLLQLIDYQGLKNQDHIGISKFSCALCYLSLEASGFSEKVAGCHGRSVDPLWEAPAIPGLVEKMAINLLAIGNPDLQKRLNGSFESILKEEKQSILTYAIETFLKEAQGKELVLDASSKKPGDFEKIINDLETKIETRIALSKSRRIKEQFIIQIGEDETVKQAAGYCLENERSKERNVNLIGFSIKKGGKSIEDTLTDITARIEDPDGRISVTVVSHEQFMNDKFEKFIEIIKKALEASYNLEKKPAIVVSLVICNKPTKGKKEKMTAEARAKELFERLRTFEGGVKLNISVVVARDGFVRVGGYRNEEGKWVGRTQYADQQKGQWFFRSSEAGAENKSITYFSHRSQQLVTETVPVKDKASLDYNFFTWSESLSQAENFADLTASLKKDHHLAENFELEIKSLKASINGKRTIKFVDTLTKQPGSEIELKESEFQKLEEFKDYLHTQLSNTREVNSPHGLTAAFAVLAVFDFLEKNKVQRTPISSVKEWLNYSQLLLDTGHEIYKFADIVNTASKGLNSGLFGAKATIGISKASGYGGTAFSLVFVGLDVVELFTAQTNFAREIAQTQLLVDASNASLALTGLGLTAAGLTTAGAFLGSLAAPIGAIGFGVLELEKKMIEERQIALDKAQYFSECKKDYFSIWENCFWFEDYALISLGYSDLFVDENCKISNKKARYNHAVIEKIDLTNQKEIKITTGSQYIYKSLGQEEWNQNKIIYYNHFTATDQEKENALNLKNLLDISINN